MKTNYLFANLCMMFSLHLYPEKEHPDKERILNNFKKMFGAKDIESSLKTFNNYLEEYQNNQYHYFLKWDARELLESLAASKMSVLLKNKDTIELTQIYLLCPFTIW
ncbi:hypothetical protein [Paenibacillus alvei]|uniref:hypothetical protein n=1 Tax=Paenibacillus alvei TaxID=44250 RepID=UPI00228105CE|nr:hypothetical protein [Paenibacillus alvei]MCY7484239.1 hypothetical protein [Paenibacillus alvei]